MLKPLAMKSLILIPNDLSQLIELLLHIFFLKLPQIYSSFSLVLLSVIVFFELFPVTAQTILSLHNVACECYIVTGVINL